MNRFCCSLLLAFCVPMMTPDRAAAQWSNDPAVNLAIADRSGEQVQAKLRVTPGGGVYASWFDNAAGGYDVYLQLLDAVGQELWAHNGVLLADRDFSSTQDYDLDIDTGGNALLAFRDDRSGSTQITATRVDPAGTQLWGATGVQLTSGSDFVAAPKIAGTTDGNVVVAWTSNDQIKLQKLDADGNPLWGAGVTIPAIGGDSISASDLEASDSGGVIISMVRGFLSPKHLHAQKFDSTGTPLWGAIPLAVYDGGALQTANFPQFVTDGSGGAAFAWYSVSGALQSHAQWVQADGSEAFGHNGVVVSTAPRNRTAPAVSFNPLTQETFVVWREEIGGGSPQYGVYGQKLSATGMRLWTDAGAEIEPLSTTELTQITQVDHADGLIASWVETLTFGDQRIHAARADGDGMLVWNTGSVNVSTVASSKSRLTAAAVGQQAVVLAWSDGRDDANDVYGQRVNSNGSLGAGGVVPAASAWGLIIMAVMLAGCGALALRRADRRAPNRGS